MVGNLPPGQSELGMSNWFRDMGVRPCAIRESIAKPKKTIGKPCAGKTARWIERGTGAKPAPRALRL